MNVGEKIFNKFVATFETSNISLKPSMLMIVAGWYLQGVSDGQMQPISDGELSIFFAKVSEYAESMVDDVDEMKEEVLNYFDI